jgi:Concanavalin A-like lectin/glucanases superfamily
MRPFHGLSLCLAAALGGGAGAAETLRFDFDDTTALAGEPAPLPAAQILGPVSPSAAFPGSADFHGGALKRAGFRSPKGPFSVEAHFRIRTFPPESGRFTAELVNTATWDIGRTQGFDTRVGGAYLYPVLPRTAYRTEAEWENAQGGYSHIDAGRMSACFPTFVMAREDDQRLWKQVFADRCIEPNAWTHLVTVWDGTAIRLYLNGLEATDPWRITFPGSRPYLDSVVDLFVGARNAGAWDMVPFDGIIDYVKIEDVALPPAEIHKRYQATFVPGKRDSLCWGVLVPVYPEAGQVCKGRLRIETKVFNHGACTDPDFLAGFLAGDSVAIEIAKNPDFDPVAAVARFASLSFDLDLGDFPSLAGYQGSVYWRVRLIHPGGTPALAKRSAVAAAPASADAPAPEWSLSRPIVLEASATSIRPGPAPRLLRAERGMLLAGRGEPALYDLSGQRVPARFGRAGEAGGRSLWRLESFPAGAGVLLAR